MSLSSSSQHSHGKATTRKEEGEEEEEEEEAAATIEKSTTRESHPGLKNRSSTSPDRHLSPTFSSLRSRTSLQSNIPSLQLHRPSNAISAFPSPVVLPTLAECLSEKPTAPIDIPARKTAQGQLSRPTTPLTARAPQGEYFTIWQKGEPRISESLTPYYSSRAKHPSDKRDTSATQRRFTQMGPRSESSRYRPSSTLSSKTSNPLPSINSSQKSRIPPQSLNLAGLPKYHPANFPPKGSIPAPPSPLSPRSIASQPRPAPGSDAKQQILQYQRDLINNIAKTSRSLASSSVSSKPSPPRLNPRGSPSGPMTPFMLEGASDYLVAGSGSLPAGFKEGDGRELVERLVRRENERRNSPDARSGSVSPALSLSPAVSPAGGRG